MANLLHNKRPFIISLVVYACLLLYSQGIEEQCHRDCYSSTSRLSGPTRPWNKNDDLGNKLSLSRPYPYSIAASEVLALESNITLRLRSQDWLSLKPLSSIQTIHTSVLSRAERLIIIKIAKNALTNFSSHKVIIINEKETLPINATANNSQSEIRTVDITLKLQIIPSHNGYDDAAVESFFSSILWPEIRNYVQNGNFTKSLAEIAGAEQQFTAASISFPRAVSESTGPPKYRTYLKLHAENPNPYSKFCEVGCTLFFSSASDPMHLYECTQKCDKMYQYNITVGYNDLMEVARLECRDGCQIALKRCRPGYFCSQVSLFDNDQNTEPSEGKIQYSGGYMAHCPAGTYRDISYDAIEVCVDCPPGRYREDIKGKSLDSCTKCPVGTYVNSSGSTSVRDCLRCPAGYFASDSGSAYCKCITPDSCKDDQLPSPADAEKRETVPFIGRW